MLSIITPNDSFTAVMSGAAATTNPTYRVIYEGEGVINEVSGSLTGATAVTLVSAPKAGRRIVKSVRINNLDSAAVTLTLTKIENGTSVASAPITAQANDTIVVDASGVRVTDSTGGTRANLTPAAVNLDLGASGTAGTLDIFPSTASKGKLAVSVTDQTGDTTVDLVIGAMAAARTITLADPLASADILTGKMSAVARTATADGTTTGTIAAAGLLQFVTVTSADANHIVVLPTPTPGRIVILHVAATGYELRTSDPATIGINGGTGAGAESAIGANTTVVMICATATSWKGLQLGSDGTLAKVEVAA